MARDIPVPGGTRETAQNLRREYSISHDAKDKLAVASHQRAVAAQRAGRFINELVPLTLRRESF